MLQLIIQVILLQSLPMIKIVKLMTIFMKIDCLDQKSALLNQKMSALDKGDTTLADQLQLQIDNIRC
jgi:hypothetical protein